MSRFKSPETTALVLSGGGARGAYEVGVLEGIREALELRRGDPAPLRILAGSSVGAINAAYLAAHVDEGDLGLDKLLQLWRGLRLETHLRVLLEDLFGWSFLRRVLRRSTEPPVHLGRSLLDPRPLEDLVTGSIPWERLHANAQSGDLRALMVAALHVGSGRTTIFGELSEGVSFRPSKDPRRVARLEPIGAPHVLASAAIPFVFPARLVGETYYCDGGLRFATPIAPALRVGATRLVVVSVMHELAPAGPPLADQARILEHYPSPFFLAGKVLNALLLDPVVYDLHVLERFNRLIGALEQSLDAEAMAKFQQLMGTLRGIPYRKVETLTFFPSEDLGIIAGEHIRERLPGWKLGWAARRLLGAGAALSASREADWASYVLFEGAYTERLIDLGRRDALNRADEVQAFFNAEV